MSYEDPEILTDTYVSGNIELDLINTTNKGLNWYFNHDEEPSTPSTLSVCAEFKHPDKKLRSTKMFLNIRTIRRFLNEEKLHTEHIEELSYERMECYICMSGAESELYTHKNTNAFHFHKDCYHELTEQVEQFLKNNIITVQSEDRQNKN